MASRVVSRAGRTAVQSLLGRSVAVPISQTAASLNHVRSSTQQFSVQHLACLSGQSQLRFFSDKAAPTPPEEEEEKQAPKEEEAPAEDAAAEEETPAEPEVSREEQLEEELKEAKDQLLRSLAEQENTRRIAKRDVADARNFAVKSFAKSLLDVSDNLSRALEAVPEDMRKDTENNPTLATLYEGIEMTETGLTKAFEMNGLKKFGVPGEPFDPNKHEALYEFPDSTREPGTVGQVIKVGYLLNDRVLRPAEVGVVKKE